jgi:DNA-binding response OmpR family regulator
MLDENTHREPPPKRVVVVEDDPNIALLIAAILEDAGYWPYVVKDGRQALQVIRELQPDAITLDLELPGLDGRTVLRRLVEENPAAHVPVVVVSGSTELLSCEDRLMIACALTKPFDLIDLVDAVDAIVARHAS